MTALRCEVIEDYAGLAALRDHWRALCDACPNATPFQRPEWLLAWIRQFGPTEPWILAAWAKDRLVGLAPLFIYSRGSQRVLALLGAGVSDFLDVCVAPGLEREVIAALLDLLTARHDRWDVCELDQIRPTISPLTRVQLPTGWSTRELARCPCPSLSLPASVDALDRHVPIRHLRRFRQYQRRAEQLGELRLEPATVATCAPLLDAAIRLHQARWHERGEQGAFADPRTRALHHEAAAAFAARDGLALYALHLDDRIIACIYGFEDEQSIYYYLGGFDLDLASLSPGVLVVGMVIEAAIRRGRRRFEFLRGGEAYKYWWGAEDETTVRLALLPP